jgi:hypothetical protein
MYKIIGSDGHEYGPVSPEQLRQWVREGRANTRTLTQAVGSTEWKPLGSVPELAQVATPTPPAAPPSPGLTPVPGPRATNSMAVAGLIFGVLGLTGGWICCGPVFSVFGIVFSSVGLSQINRHPDQETGKGIALAGLVLSILGLVAAVVLGILLRTLMWRHPPFYGHRQWRF